MHLPEWFAHLSTSNTPPNPLEISSIKEELAIRREALANHRREVERLESECQAYEALLAPLRCMVIPPEILGAIFQEVMLETPLEASMLQLQNVCLVCRAWREVALAAPGLWVDLRLSLNKTHTLPTDKIEAWFSLSGSLPKRLHIDSTGITTPHGEPCPLHSPDFASLLGRSIILQDLSLECDSLACLTAFITLVNDSRVAPNAPWDSLSKLTLDGRWGWGSNIGGSQAAIEILPHLPTSLSTLHIFLPYYDEIPSEFYTQLRPISLPDLPVLVLDCDWPVAWILKTIEACSNVRSLELSFRGAGVNFGEGHTNSANLPKITQPNLQTLRLRGLLSRYNNDTAVLDLFSCPSITELDISFENESEDIVTLMEDPRMEESGLATNITKFIRQSEGAESLRHFRLHGLKILSTGLLPVLLPLSSVTHLTLEDLDVDEYLCRILNNPQVLPSLEVLEFIHFPLTFEEVEFGQLVSNRSPAGLKRAAERLRSDRATRPVSPVPLKKATLSHYTKHPYPPKTTWPQSLKEDGVDCSMTLIWDA